MGVPRAEVLKILHAEFAERRKFFTEYMPFWRLEYDVFHGIRGIRVEYVRNTGRWEVIWNKYSFDPPLRSPNVKMSGPPEAPARAKK